MSLLKNLKTDDSSIKGETDSLGGRGVVDSGLYPAKIGYAYVKESAGGALGLFVLAKLDNGKEINNTFWMTSGKDKGQKNYYEKDNQKHYLPGYLQAEALALLTIGKPISDLDTEQKVISLYDFAAKAEVPTKVDMIMDLVGQEVLLGVVKQTVDKTKKNESTGQYEPTGETREQNEIDKIFRARDKMTVAEIRGEAPVAMFADKWAEKNTGKTQDRSTKAGGTAGAPGKGGSSGAAPGSTKPAKSLFGN